MTRDEVLEMARKAGFLPVHFNRTELSAYPAGLERFAALVAERTRQDMKQAVKEAINEEEDRKSRISFQAARFR